MKTPEDVFENIDPDVFHVPLTSMQLPQLKSVDFQTPMLEVVNTLQKNKMGSVTVTDGNKLVGIITERDCLLKVVGKLDNWREVPVEQVMTASPITVHCEGRISECIQLIAKQEFRHIPVVDDNGAPVHMVTINDILRFVVKFFPNRVEKLGTLTRWEVMQVDIFGENFSFGNQEEGRLSGNVFLSPIRKCFNKEPLKMDESSSLQEVLQAMQARSSGVALLTRYETELRGIITERDFLFKIFGKIRLDEGPVPVKDFMTRNPHTLLSKHFIAYAINNMFTFHYRNIVVVDEDRVPVAVVGLLDIFKYLADFLMIGTEILDEDKQ